MMEQQHSGAEFFIDGNGVADLGLIATPGAHELTALIDSHLVRWANRKGLNKETFIIPSECPRFSSGDGKGVIKNTVRGDDLYFVVDVGNYSCKYRLFGSENSMSPDDHYQDLKRLIQAATRCRSCRAWAWPTSSPSTPTTPGCPTRCP